MLRQLPHLPDEQGLLLGWEVWLTCPLSEVAPTPISPVEVCATSSIPLRDANAHGDQAAGEVFMPL